MVRYGRPLPVEGARRSVELEEFDTREPVTGGARRAPRGPVAARVARALGLAPAARAQAGNGADASARAAERGGAPQA